MIVAIVFAFLGYNFQKEKSLFDENGEYSEEAFAHNMQMNKINGITLFDKKETDYKIIYPENSDELITTAANEMKNALEKISGANFFMTTDNTPASEREICIGKTNRRFIPKQEFKDIAAYCIVTSKNNLYLYSDTEYGVSNSVYGFLEDIMGCMYLDEDDTYYPSYEKAVLPQLNDYEEPAFEKRTVYAKQLNSNDSYTRKLRLSGNETFFRPGCHNSLCFISPEEYFDEHPEYFALIKGKRRGSDYMFQHTQLCWSNPDVVELLKEKIGEKIAQYEASGIDMTKKYIDISIEDSINQCTCDECKAMYEAAGSDIGAVLSAVNEVARAYPDYNFATLAYHECSTPPTNLVPEKNVLIQYCFMAECGDNDYSQSVVDAKEGIGKRMHDDLLGWSQLTDNIYIWDYVTNYFNYQIPFPCFQSLQGNMQFMRDCNVRSVFSLGASPHRGSSDCLKNYLIAKLLWNPDYNMEELMNKYLTIYYGDASIYIREYYKEISDRLEGKLWVYDFPKSHKNDYLSLDAINTYMDLYNKATNAVNHNEKYLKRLRYDKISLLYSILALGYYPENKDENIAEIKDLFQEFEITGYNELNIDLLHIF